MRMFPGYKIVIKHDYPVYRYMYVKQKRHRGKRKQNCKFKRIKIFHCWQNFLSAGQIIADDYTNTLYMNQRTYNTLSATLDAMNSVGGF
jgi:hypothetical protein